MRQETTQRLRRFRKELLRSLTGLALFVLGLTVLAFVLFVAPFLLGFAFGAWAAIAYFIVMLLLVLGYDSWKRSK